MTGWDILDTIIKAFPPLTAALLLAAAGIIFIIGFSKHGMNFIKYGFMQMALDSSLEKRFDDLGARIDGLGTEIDGLRTELSMIKVNHFGHLKNFLTELTSILLDKNVINNQDKARLDNELRGM
ncbi:MAG: hypothetical protein LBD08_01595 [Treponema sp.]|jgi:hypothetical protein|nr:hypothetical protein [Treponema sp.]